MMSLINDRISVNERDKKTLLPSLVADTSMTLLLEDKIWTLNSDKPKMAKLPLRPIGSTVIRKS